MLTDGRHACVVARTRGTVSLARHEPALALKPDLDGPGHWQEGSSEPRSDLDAAAALEEASWLLACYAAQRIVTRTGTGTGTGTTLRLSSPARKST